jgi:hypothetical protein
MHITPHVIVLLHVRLLWISSIYFAIIFAGTFRYGIKGGINMDRGAVAQVVPIKALQKWTSAQQQQEIYRSSSSGAQKEAQTINFAASTIPTGTTACIFDGVSSGGAVNAHAAQVRSIGMCMHCSHRRTHAQ